MEKGLIHIYCGEGVGKTTASVGLAIRAAGNDQRVVFAQFMKGSPSGEIEILKKISNISVYRNDIDFGFSPSFSEETKENIRKLHNSTLYRIKNDMENQKIDLLILDEINSAYELDLIDRELVEEIVVHKPEHLELVLTGRNPNGLFLEKADYVSEIKCLKHPFYKGVAARKGIEY